jgi:hypothetical protein
LDLLNNNGTGKADTGSYHGSRYSLFGKAKRKTTYNCPEPAVNSITLTRQASRKCSRRELD